MAIANFSYTTYSQIGAREHLTDIIENISPMDTWFTSNSGTGPDAKQRYVEWQTDSLKAAAANAQYEGDDSPANLEITPTTRTGNYCQILRKVFMVTEGSDGTDTAGRDSELAYQTEKHMKELARDIEYALIINTTSASGATGTARQLKGLQGWITTNVTTGSATGTQQLSETMYNDNLQLIWAQGGNPATTLCGAFQKRLISSFTTNTRQAEADSKKLTQTVGIYESDFGTMRIRLHRQINTTIPEILINLGDMKLWKKSWFRKVKKVPLAKTGDATKIMLIGELTLMSLQEKGSGMITELTTS